MSIEFSIVGCRDGVKLDSNIALFEDVVIKRDFDDLKIFKGKSLLFHTDSETFLDFKASYGLCSLEMNFDGGQSSLIKNESKETLFLIRSFDGFDKWNVLFSDEEVVPVVGSFEVFYLRVKIWSFFTPTKLKIISPSEKNNLLMVLCISAFMWLRHEMYQHSS